MKKRFILLALLLTAVGASAQAPDWQWAAQAGGTSYDSGYGITTDTAGNSYVTGSFFGTASFGSLYLNSYGSGDIFVAKMDSDGNWLWTSRAGGNNADIGIDVAITDDEDCYVTGRFENTAVFGSFNTLVSSGVGDIFVAKLYPGGYWQWAVRAGGNSEDYADDITLDEDGNIYITGRFENTATFGTHTITSNGGKDIFIAKLDEDGIWQWAVQAGGTNNDLGNGISIDAAGSSYVTGSFSGTATFGSNSLSSSGEEDVFVAKIDTNGNWQWATQAGGGWGTDLGYGITTDIYNNSYVTGSFFGTASFGSLYLNSYGANDIFVAKIDTNGNWQWAVQAGASGWQEGYEITHDTTGNCYVTGYIEGSATFGSHSIVCNGGIVDIFVAKIDANGNWLWAANAGGGWNDYGRGISTDGSGNCYVTGDFQLSADFGSYTINGSGQTDIFVAKLGNDTSVENEIIPTEIKLSNYPNPFNPSTTIEFSIKENEAGVLSIYNLRGEKILKESFEAGNHQYHWNAEGLASGIYFYKLSSPTTNMTKKMILLK